LFLHAGQTTAIEAAQTARARRKFQRKEHPGRERLWQR
jgi:hypothetical protein